jgi:hypothetical protein
MRGLPVIQRSRFTPFEILSRMDGMTKGVTKSYTPGGKSKRPIIQKSHLPIFEIVLPEVQITTSS